MLIRRKLSRTIVTKDLLQRIVEALLEGLVLQRYYLKCDEMMLILNSTIYNVYKYAFVVTNLTITIGF